MGSNSAIECEQSAGYAIYNVTGQPETHTLHTAAQFGEEKFIVNLLERTLDIDVNALVCTGFSCGVGHGHSITTVVSTLHSCRANAAPKWPDQ
jgi:hypothetical protein